MRILCLNLKKSQNSSVAELFLSLSPLVQFRFPHYVFIDIASTSHLHDGESAALDKALQIAQVITPEAKAAIADTPSVAQMLALWKPRTITLKGHDFLSFQGLGMDALKELEGLKVWEKKQSLNHIITFLHSLGLFTLEDIYKLSLQSMRERWGDVGVTLWNRLHGQDFQILSPFIPSEPFVGYGYMDHPLIDAHLLKAVMKPHLDYLWARLEGRARFAQSIELLLRCEYSDKEIIIKLTPVSPTRDRNLFDALLDQQLEKLDLENPIREFEIKINDQAEKSHQLDFFEIRDNREDRWQKLLSVAKQGHCQMGFLQIKDHHFPEKSFSLSQSQPAELVFNEVYRTDDQALQLKTIYAKALGQSPRPSLLLKEPQPLKADEVRQVQFVSRLPAERIESDWWNFSETFMKYRDYYFALSQEGQWLWIFQDRLTEKFYLHGYFD